jgi:D-3-phosphoglycerate dehydrogenase
LNKKVVFLDTVHPILMKRLQLLQYECIEAYDWSEERLRSEIADVFGIVLRSRLTMTKHLLSAANGLAFIARSGAGMENIDTDFATKSNIQCFNSPEGNRDAVGEHALGMLLNLFNHIVSGNEEVKSGKWQREKHRGIELCGKTVGILGYGYMGSAFASKLSGLNCRVIAYDKYKSNFGGKAVEEVTLETLFKETEVLSIHLPLNNETKYLVNSAFISNFANPFFIINTARGPVVNTADLIEGLKDGKIRGACLDVLEWEDSSFEMSDSNTFQLLAKTLYAMNNVILSPHVAGWTVESYEKLATHLADKIEAAFHSH